MSTTTVEAYARLGRIASKPRATPPVVGLLPFSAATFLRMVRAGKMPKPVHLGPRTTAWRLADIQAALAALAQGPAAGGKALAGGAQ